MSKFLDKQSSGALYQAIISIRDEEECRAFLEDLCTISELKALSQRIQVAKMLSDHRVYSDIVQATGASTATISRVNRCCTYGAGGYRTVLDRLEEETAK